MFHLISSAISHNEQSKANSCCAIAIKSNLMNGFISRTTRNRYCSKKVVSKPENSFLNVLTPEMRQSYFAIQFEPT